MGRLILNKDTKLVTKKTPLVLLEANKELCKKVSDGIVRLADLQEQLIRILPDCKKQMPGSAELLGDVKHQAEVLLYIQGLSLYFFVDAVWKIIKGQCIEMTKMYNNEMREDVEEKKVQLEKLINRLSEMPLEDLLQDTLTGFYRLDRLKDRINQNFDFPVISPNHGSWTFRDIAGTIAEHGITELLWKDFHECPYPEYKSIISMEKDEDLKMVP